MFRLSDGHVSFRVACFSTWQDAGCSCDIRKSDLICLAVGDDDIFGWNLERRSVFARNILRTLLTTCKPRSTVHREAMELIHHGRT